MRFVTRFAFAGMTAALLAGCADSSRLIGDPLGNPFKSASTAPAPMSDMAPPPASSYSPRPYQRSAAITSQPLAPPSGLPSRRVATYVSPAHESPRLASNYSAPRTERTASIPASSGHGGWSATGGMAVIAATGESGAILAQRYNVPEDALLRANGFSSSAQVRAGTRVVIPVYSANTAATPAPDHHIASAEPVRKAHDHASRERLIAKHDREQPKHEVAQRDMPKHEVAQRDMPKHEVAQRDVPKHETLHWVKGPQSAVEKKMAERKGYKQKIADGKVAEKALAEQNRQAKADKAAQKLAKADADSEKPIKAAKLEDEAPVKKPPVDPTPTASLPPTTEKLASNGNPEFRWPAHGRIIQGFKTGGNDGINIAVPEGTSVKAAESGVVAYAGNEIKGFGNLVLIRHPNGYVSAYANNADLAVHKGEQVKRGQTIAKSGQSGNVASPQLHFELRKGSTPVDPTRYLAGL